MAEAIAQKDPIGEVVAKMISPATAGVTSLPIKVDKIALIAATGNGGLGNWQNPLDQDVIAEAIMDLTTVFGAASTVDVGVAATATTLGDNLIDGVVGTATGVFNSSTNAGTNGRLFRKVDKKGGTNPFITMTLSAGTLGSPVGSFIIKYFPMA